MWFGFIFQALSHFPWGVWKDETVTLKKCLLAKCVIADTANCPWGPFSPLFLLVKAASTAGEFQLRSWAPQLQSTSLTLLCNEGWPSAEFWPMEGEQLALDAVFPSFLLGMWKRINLPTIQWCRGPPSWTTHPWPVAGKGNKLLNDCEPQYLGGVLFVIKVYVVP